MFPMFTAGMPIFGDTLSPYDECIEKVTAETCTTENWALIVDICDRVVAEQNKGAKMCLLSLKKRLNHRDPHVVLLALSVLDSLWSNCGVHFRREVSSREFLQELESKATHSNRAIGEKTRVMIKKWAENECSNDASLGLVESLYKNLISQGFSFDNHQTSSSKSKEILSTDPNVVQSAEEEEAIARAIALSLSDSQRKNSSANRFLSDDSINHKCMQRDVRALYDFEAAEDNELTFCTGDIITVTDDSDPNWWRGKSSRGEGLFPASFVTSQLNDNNTNKHSSGQSPEQQYAEQTRENVEIARIDESILLECIRLLEDCDPTGERADPPELADTENRSYAQIPLIDARLAEIDKQHNALAQVDIAIRDVLAMYDRAVQQLQYQVDSRQQATYGTQPYPQ